MVVGLNPITVTQILDIAPVSSNAFLDIPVTTPYLTSGGWFFLYLVRLFICPNSKISKKGQQQRISQICEFRDKFFLNYMTKMTSSRILNQRLMETKKYDYIKKRTTNDVKRANYDLFSFPYLIGCGVNCQN